MCCLHTGDEPVEGVPLSNTSRIPVGWNEPRAPFHESRPCIVDYSGLLRFWYSVKLFRVRVCAWLSWFPLESISHPPRDGGRRGTGREPDRASAALVGASQRLGWPPTAKRNICSRYPDDGGNVVAGSGAWAQQGNCFLRRRDRLVID